ncbi:MAG: hexose kinase [Pseudomonadota bacterium]
MTPVLTVTLNPALDMSTEAPRVAPNAKLRCAAPRLDPGGGGANVSRALARLGGEGRAFIAAGGATGREYRALLEAEGLAAVWFDPGVDLRRSLAVTEAASGDQYRFLLPGAPWPASTVSAALDAVSAAAGPRAIVALSGSQPPGAPDDLPLRLAERLAAQGVGLAVDTSGAALDACVSGGAAPLELLRMDRSEAGGVLGLEKPDEADALAFGRRLVASGAARQAVITLAGEGAVAVSSDAAWRVQPPVIQVVSAVGAGDSFLAGFLTATQKGEDLRGRLALAMAAAAAAVMTPATELCRAEDVAALLPRMQLRPLA